MRRRFRADPVAMGAAVVLVLLLVTAALFFTLRLFQIPFPANPDLTDLAGKLRPPGPDAWLGTDNLGRDVCTRLLHGTYISLMVGVVAVVVAVGIGVVVGAVSGYAGGWVDNVLMRIVDAMMCFPSFFLILTVVALLGPSLFNVILVMGLVGWTGSARLVRAEFLSLRESEYVRAARALGQSHLGIVFRHIFPNAAGPIFVTAVLGVPGAILSEASLSFLGLGVQPPQSTWGNIIADGRTYLLDAWWLILFPGVAILITALSFYLVGDGLRRAAQTKRERE